MTQEEFDTWSKKTNTNSWDIEYKKGLASLENDEYEEIIRNPRYFVVEKGKNFKGVFSTWFGGDSQPRKYKILGTSPEPIEELEPEPTPSKPKAEKKEPEKKEKKSISLF